MFTRLLSRARTSTALAATATATAALVALSACTSSPGTQASDRDDTVTLLTYDSYAISKKTLREFTDLTGLEVEIIRGGDAAEVVNRALLTAGNPEADVLFGVDNNLMSRTLTAGLFVPHQPVDADKLPREFVLDPQFRVTPIDVGDVCINYDKAYFRDRKLPAPKTLDDLAKDRYRDLLVVTNPATSTPGLAFLLATVAEYGPDGFGDYWQRLRTNEVAVENSWDNAYLERFSGGSGKGDRPLVVSYASSPPYEALNGDTGNGKAPTGVLVDTCYRQIEFAGVLANAENPAAGQELIDFMVSRPYQRDLPLQNFVWPVRPVRLPKVFTDNAEVVDDPLVVAPDQVAADRDEWVDTWTDVMQR